jgi:hypothetical protein
LPFSPWAVSATWLHVGTQTSPSAYTESELDVLGVPDKLVKYVVHLSKILKKIYFSSHKLPKLQSTTIWSQGILGVKLQSFDNNLGTPPKK